MAQLNMSLDKMPAKSRELYDQLMQDRGKVGPMYIALLNHPDLTERVSQLGDYLRFHGTLPGDVREVMILLTGYKLGTEYEWIHHVPPARDAGVPDAVIEAIRGDRPLAPLSVEYGMLEQLHAFVVAGRSIPSSLQHAVIAKWGVGGVLELVVLVGFYGMIGDIISSFDVPEPATDSAT